MVVRTKKETEKREREVLNLLFLFLPTLSFSRGAAGS